MKKYVISIIIVILIMVVFLVNNKTNTYTTNLFYMDTYINVKIYTKSKRKADQGLKLADAVFKEYHNLTNRYDENSEVYYINNNKSDDEVLVINEKLYDLIKMGIDYYDKTNGLFNINMGNVIDVWKKYRTDKNGVPTIQELKNSGSIDINKIQLLENNKIENTHPNIDLGSIAKGYATEKLGEELKSIGINSFIINAGGNVLVGDKANETFKIGLESPLKDGELYQIVRGENVAVVTSGGYERFYEYDNQVYHHIIDPFTYMPPNYMKSVTVIAKSSALADILSTTLFLMPVEEGKEYLKQFDDVEAIWFIKDNEIIKSEGFSKYE